MKMFTICSGSKIADFIIEEQAFDGVKEIGETVAEDIRLVADYSPRIIDSENKVCKEVAVLFATVSRSTCLEKLENKGKISLDGIRGKREVYQIEIVEDPFDDNTSLKRLLVIAGSDKRGTIYGMFELSKMCGVSPLVYFGDAVVAKKNPLEIAFSDADAIISKEPSVYYRGFFINDEWPAFGNWATEKFGDVNAKCYRKVFELLLRLKGNYMWPAMWNSNFSEDGPGLESAILADKLGVIMGTSHHEPLCRAGNEWQQQYKKYGDDNSWSFLSNKDAIEKFWEDGVLRNRDFENVYTIGMRGEADSKLLPEDATMKDNIEVVKSAIRSQNSILKRLVSDDLKEVPRMLAIYKEVEDYYYGDDTCEGLKDWDELKDCLFLLSDDNHGNLRNLPTKEERNHAGGYGMYYHFDYHGAPISYEWVNCNRLTKTYEQMTTAFEAGVQKMWIVNVGDLKEMEYPLSFFMDLAYDYETYGRDGLNRVKEYVYSWIDQQFGDSITSLQKDKLFKVIEGYTRYNALRTPETMNEHIYNPVHFNEGERVLEEVRNLLNTADELKEELTGAALLTYKSIFYYAAAGSFNMIIAWVLTAMNYDYAQKKSLYANSFIKEIEDRIALDGTLVDEFHKMNDGKWNHCLASAHTGFRSWDDREWQYPSTIKVSPLTVPKAILNFKGQDRYHLGAYWQDMAPLECNLVVNDEKSALASLNIATRGSVGFRYKITLSNDLVKADKKSGTVIYDDKSFGLDSVRFVVDDGELTKLETNEGNGIKKENEVNEIKEEKEVEKVNEIKEVKGRVDITFENGQKTYVDLLFKVQNLKNNEVGELRPYCVVYADSFKQNEKVEGKGFEVVDYLGREKSAIKVFPPMETFDKDKAPFVRYSFIADEEGTYDLVFTLLTRNPSYRGGRMKFYVSANGEGKKEVYSVHEGYYTEWQDETWAQGVLRAARETAVQLQLRKGENEIFVYAGEPGVIIEKLLLKKLSYTAPTSYLGPID